MFRIMATVVAIVKQDLKTHPEVDTLIFQPVKKQGAIDNRHRTDLYLSYIKHSWPGTKIEKKGDVITAKIK